MLPEIDQRPSRRPTSIRVARADSPGRMKICHQSMSFKVYAAVPTVCDDYDINDWVMMCDFVCVTLTCVFCCSYRKFELHYS